MQVDVGTWATAAHSLGVWLMAGLVSGWLIGVARGARRD